MRVLFAPYPGTDLHQGGHRTQQVELAESLARLGVAVELGEVELAVDGAFDLVQTFGDIRYLRGVELPCPLVDSCDFWPPELVALPPSYRGTRRELRAATWRRKVRRARRAVRRRVGGGPVNDRLRALTRAAALLVHSEDEGRRLAADAPVRLPPVHVVRNGVAARFFDGDPVRGRSLLGIESAFVLSVGRIEAVKNQTTLAAAMRGSNLPLVLVGEVLPRNEPYLDACRALLPSLRHVPEIPHDELPHVYAAASVHVLPSWFEITGLSTLEALAAGTPTVAPRTPAVEEYVGGVAELHRPGEAADLQRAIARALRAPRDTGRARARELNWDSSAEVLLEVYRTVIAS